MRIELFGLVLALKLDAKIAVGIDIDRRAVLWYGTEQNGMADRTVFLSDERATLITADVM